MFVEQNESRHMIAMNNPFPPRPILPVNKPYSVELRARARRRKGSSPHLSHLIVRKNIYIFAIVVVVVVILFPSSSSFTTRSSAIRQVECTCMRACHSFEMVASRTDAHWFSGDRRVLRTLDDRHDERIHVLLSDFSILAPSP